MPRQLGLVASVEPRRRGGDRQRGHGPARRRPDAHADRGHACLTDDIVEQGLRHRLLGEDLPAALDGFGFLLPKVSLVPIHDLPPDIAGAVAHLLLVEALVGKGHATTVQTRLGGGPRGGHRIVVEWQPPAWAGAASAPRRVEGRLVEEGAGDRRRGA
jgi:hypothetical protein